MKKKKILHIVEAFGGGIFSFLVDLVNNTSDEYDITIMYSIREQTPVDFKNYFNKNVNFIESKYLTRELSFHKDYNSIIEVKRVVKLIDPDVIHLHSSKAGAIGRLAINCRKMKVLYTPHSFSFLKKDDSKIKRFVYWFIEKVLALKGGYIVGCSFGEYEEALKLSNKSLYVNNGIDTKKLDILIKKIDKKETEKNTICTIGRISYQKNPKLFNEIALKLPEYKFTWIGDGEQRNYLTSPNIKITGWLNRDEVLKEVNENNSFILTSLWEGLPISLLEAMYMNKLCFVSNVIGNKDVIKDGENGYICNDLDEYISKLLYSLNSSNNEIEKLKQKAYKDICDEYNIFKMAKNYKKIYNSK